MANDCGGIKVFKPIPNPNRKKATPKKTTKKKG